MNCSEAVRINFMRCEVKQADDVLTIIFLSFICEFRKLESFVLSLCNITYLFISLFRIEEKHIGKIYYVWDTE